MVLASYLSQQARDLSPDIRPHREEVDDVGPVVAVLVASGAGGTFVAPGPVADRRSGQPSRRCPDRTAARAARQALQAVAPRADPMVALTCRANGGLALSQTTYDCLPRGFLS